MSCSAAVMAPVSDVGITPTPMDVDAEEFETVETKPVIIFDWDDTLLASSWVSSLNLRLDSPLPIPESATKQLSQLAGSIVKVLRLAKKAGQVVIITNAETGWVELSAKHFVPAAVDELRDVRIVSARSTYECDFPSQPHKWKLQAFAAELRDVFDAPAYQPPCVISFGDSVHERDAVHKVCESLPSTLTKSVKFVERPSVEQLQRELDLVCRCFDFIIDHREPLDLMLTIQLLSS